MAQGWCLLLAAAASAALPRVHEGVISPGAETAAGRVYDGCGIVADSSSKLLASYDQPRAAEILDYFFL